MRSQIVDLVAHGAPPQLAAEAARLVGTQGNIADQLVGAGFVPAAVLEACCTATGLPAAPQQWLQNPAPPAVEGLDLALCLRLGAAPIAATGGRLCIAYADPETAAKHRELGLPRHQAYLALSANLKRALGLLSGRGLPRTATARVDASIAIDVSEVADDEADEPIYVPDAPVAELPPMGALWETLPSGPSGDDDYKTVAGDVAALQALRAACAAAGIGTPNQPKADLKSTPPAASIEDEAATAHWPTPAPFRGPEVKPGASAKTPAASIEDDAATAHWPTPAPFHPGPKPPAGRSSEGSASAPAPGSAKPRESSGSMPKAAAPAASGRESSGTSARPVTGPTARPVTGPTAKPVTGPISSPTAQGPRESSGATPRAPAAGARESSGPMTPATAASVRGAVPQGPLDPVLPPVNTARETSTSRPPALTTLPRESSAAMPKAPGGGPRESSAPMPKAPGGGPRESSAAMPKAPGSPRESSGAMPRAPGPRERSGPMASAPRTAGASEASGPMRRSRPGAPPQPAGDRGSTMGTGGWVAIAAGAVLILMVGAGVTTKHEKSKKVLPGSPEAALVRGANVDATTARQEELKARGLAEQDPVAAIELFTQAILLNPAAPAARDAFVERARRNLAIGELEDAEGDLLRLKRRVDVNQVEAEVKELFDALKKARQERKRG